MKFHNANPIFLQSDVITGDVFLLKMVLVHSYNRTYSFTHHNSGYTKVNLKKKREKNFFAAEIKLLLIMDVT
jgi:hypothetical protein